MIISEKLKAGFEKLNSNAVEQGSHIPAESQACWTSHKVDISELAIPSIIISLGRDDLKQMIGETPFRRDFDDYAKTLENLKNPESEITIEDIMALSGVIFHIVRLQDEAKIES